MFSNAGLIDGDAVVEPVTCKGKGSITVTAPREGIDFKWFRLQSNGPPVSVPGGQSITNLDVATYELQISDGCKTVSQTFSITDQILTVPTITPPVPACGQTTFAFSATTLRGKGNIVYTWLNGSDNIVGYGMSVSLPQGTYKVKVSDDAGCVQVSDPVTITRRPAPVINMSTARYTPAACGKNNGAIKGVQVTDITGTASYKWYTWDNYNHEIGSVVSQTLDLENAAGGSYVLVVTDNSTCSPVESSPVSIAIYNSVVISGGYATPTTCNKQNGAISGVTIAEADTYQWQGPSMQTIEEGAYSPGMVLSLKDLSPGTYTLYAKNSVTGCNNVQSYIVYQTQPFQYNATDQESPATCDLNNGSIRLVYSTKQPQIFHWKDAEGNDLEGTATDLKSLPNGDYTLFAYDENNCESVLGPYHVNRIPKLTITPKSAHPSADHCGLRRGSVKDIEVTGGIPGPNGYIYKWEDEEGKPLPQGKESA